MGSYATCYLGHFEVGETKRDIDYGLIRLFRETDKVICRWPDDELPPEYADYADELEPDETFEVVRYEAPLEILSDRLELLGYTLRNSQIIFNDCIRFEIERVEQRISDLDTETFEHSKTLIESYKSDLAVLQSLSPATWINTLRRVRDDNLHRTYGTGNPHPDPLIAYMLGNDWYGYPGPDMNVAIRLAIEACSDAEEMIYDITDLVSGGYYSATDDLVGRSVAAVEDEHRSSSKIIILTEGKSDSRILSLALNLLFPHIAEYYSFLEFDSVRYGGGAGNLVNVVKAFAGAGVANRVVALFDNDTAASAAILNLKEVSVPKHVRIMQFPELPFLMSYPTLGPTGLVEMNVNSVAASLELFLGPDVLTEDGELLPVQWTGFDARLSRYQGEVLEKGKIQERFLRKVELATQDRTLLAESGWDDLREVFKSIFRAFENYAVEQIREEIREWYSAP